jgi:hypothetical protein
MFAKLSIAAVAAVIASGLTAQAAIHGAAVLQIPYQIELQGKVLPPGEYWVRDTQVMGYDTKILKLYKEGGQEFVASVQAVPAWRNTAPQSNMVEVQAAGSGSYKLRKIWIAFDNWGYEIPPDR